MRSQMDSENTVFSKEISPVERKNRKLKDLFFASKNLEELQKKVQIYFGSQKIVLDVDDDKGKKEKEGDEMDSNSDDLQIIPPSLSSLKNQVRFSENDVGQNHPLVKSWFYNHPTRAEIKKSS